MKSRSLIFFGLIKNHHPMYSNLLRILISKFSKIYFISPKNVRDNIKIDNNKIKYLINNHSRQELVFKENVHIANKCDYLITDEYYGLFFRVFRTSFSCRYKFIIIHNVNKWTSFLINPFTNPKNFIDLFFRYKFLNQFNYYITNSQILNKILLKKSNKQTFIIPFNFNNSNQKIIDKAISSKINILIPGIVDQKRRDYLSFLKNFYTYIINNPNSNIQIELLGTLKNNFEIMYLINKINMEKNNSIIYYIKFIDDEKFHDQIIKSDIIFSNLKKGINKQGFNEVYGLTKESGISFIIAKYSKPAIIPEWQKVFTQIEDQLIKYCKYSEISSIFAQIELNKDFVQSLKNNAVINKKKLFSFYKKEELKLQNFLDTI